MDMTLKKSFTIKDLPVSYIESFKSLQKVNQSKPAETFGKLLVNHNEQVNQVNHQAIRITELEEEAVNLVNLNKQLTLEVADLLSKLSFTESKLLETEGKLLVNLNKIEQSLKNTQFIVDPPVNLATKIKRCIAYDVVKNKFTKTPKSDYLIDFTNRALAYYIYNEYSHIQK